MNAKRWTIPASKYKAKPTTIDGIRFASKAEARCYVVLRDMKAKGEIKAIMMQIPFRLPGKTTYRCDFMIIDWNDIVRFIEVKGMRIKLGELKRKQAEELYKVGIEVWK